MNELEVILERVEAGDKLRFFQDYYGAQWVELTSGWLIKRKTRYDLAPEMIVELKNALRNRRRAAAEAAHADSQQRRRVA